MFNNQRQKDIVDLISRKGNVTVEELAETFNVSKMTIRRDLEKLQENNLLQRTHGGALVNKTLLHEITYNEKLSEYSEAKQCIAKEALKYIDDNSTIFLDAGTTTYEIANNLQTEGLTIITNDIRIASKMMLTNNTVIMLGGSILQQTGSVTDVNARDMLSTFNIDVAFMGTSGIDKSLTLCTPEIDRMKIKRQALSQAEKKILVTDHSKFYRKALYKIAPLKDFDYIISDLDESDIDLAKVGNAKFVSLLCAYNSQERK